jgi:hypothetical protein
MALKLGTDITVYPRVAKAKDNKLSKYLSSDKLINIL